MESSLIIGCNHCEINLARSKGYVFRANGRCTLPISTQVAYTESDLAELFMNHYTCPFCKQSFEITPRMMIYVKHFLDRPFHIDLHKDTAEISNGEMNYFLPYTEKIDTVLNFLASRGLHLQNAEIYLPTDEEAHQIQNISKEFDPQLWTFRIESGYASEGYLSTRGLWFNGIDDLD